MMTMEKTKVNIKSLSYNFLKTIIVLFFSTSFALILVEASNLKDNIFGIYMLAVTIISTLTPGYFWGIFSSLVGIIGVNYFFTYPYFVLNFTLSGYPLTFLIMLLISIMTSALTVKIKRQAIIASTHGKRAEILYNINKKLLSTTGMENIIALALEYFNDLYQCSVVFYDADPFYTEKFALKVVNPEHKAVFSNNIERYTAHLAFQEQNMTGVGTEFPTDSVGTYIPIVSQDTVLGLVGLILENESCTEPENLNFLGVMISQLILAIERQNLADEQQEVLIETEKEKMRSNLLRAVSHDLRTPLTCILGASTTLLESRKMLTEENKDTLLTDINQDAQWLIHMVENLLAVTRINGETAKVKKQTEAVEEVVSETVARIRKRFPLCRLNIKVPDDLLMVPMDATLIEQVLINLMENSIRHSGSKEPISLCVTSDENLAIFEVSDAGKGLNPAEMPHIFDGYSDHKTSDATRGIGIGLSICKSIITAHGGNISAENNEFGGATFRFMLPLKGEFHHD